VGNIGCIAPRLENRQFDQEKFARLGLISRSLGTYLSAERLEAQKSHGSQPFCRTSPASPAERPYPLGFTPPRLGDG